MTKTLAELKAELNELKSDAEIKKRAWEKQKIRGTGKGAYAKSQLGFAGHLHGEWVQAKAKVTEKEKEIEKREKREMPPDDGPA